MLESAKKHATEAKQLPRAKKKAELEATLEATVSASTPATQRADSVVAVEQAGGLDDVLQVALKKLGRPKGSKNVSSWDGRKKKD